MTNSCKPILVVGSINMDLVASAKRIPLAGETVAGSSFATHPGGKGANQAVAIARLGYPVRLIGRVGSDQFGDELLSGLLREGVDTDAIERMPRASGVALITVDAQGQNSIVVAAGANGGLTPDVVDGCVSQIRDAAAVLTQLEIPLETVQRLAEICDREGVALILDPAPARELPGELLRLVTWFTPNETEAAFYLQTAGTLEAAGCMPASDSATIARALRTLGPRNIILKLGGRGCHILTNDGVEASQQAVRVEAVDTTAAGDCFNGAFAMQLCLGHSPIESARFACAAAAVSVTRHGAQDSMPTLQEVNAALGAGEAASVAL